MSAEQVYERIVARVESEHGNRMRAEARKGLREAASHSDAEYREDRDYRRECAADAVEKYAFAQDDFELVKATDITDIACEIADEVEQDNWIAQL